MDTPTEIPPGGGGRIVVDPPSGNLWRQRSLPGPSAFTLIEILIVVAIITVLAALLFTGGQRMLGRAHGAACISNLKQIHVGLLTYAADHNNCLPPGYVPTTKVPWVIPAWPYFGQGEPVAPKGRRGITYCPATKVNGTGIYKMDRAGWRTDYEVNPNAMSSTESANNLSTIPGKMVMFFDSGGGASGLSAPSAQSRASARHNGEFNVLFVDGHAETLNTFTNTTADNWKKNP